MEQNVYCFISPQGLTYFRLLTSTYFTKTKNPSNTIIYFYSKNQSEAFHRVKSFLFQTICLVFIGIGVVMIILPDISVLDQLIGASTVMTKLKDTLTATGLGTEDQYSGLSLSTAFYDVGLMLAASCLFIMIIALFGCCGGCCKLKCALLTVRIVIIH